MFNFVGSYVGYIYCLFKVLATTKYCRCTEVTEILHFFRAMLEAQTQNWINVGYSLNVTLNTALQAYAEPKLTKYFESIPR